MDFSKVRLNCSRLGVVMSEPKGALTDAMFQELEKLKAKESLTEKQELKRIELQFRMDNYDPCALSKGCLSYLTFLYCYMKYGKQYPIRSRSLVPQMIKGSKMEKSSLEIVKRVTGQQFFRHKSPLKNDFLKGQVDAINGQTLDVATKIIDIKTAFSQGDFMKVMASEEIQRAINFQMQGYFAITGKEYGEVYHCLADFTNDMIEDQRREMIELLCPDGIITAEFEEEWQKAENSMRFSHIPDEERIVVYRAERDEKIIAKIYEKVEFCRDWLAQFEQKHKNKIANQLNYWQVEK